MESAFDRERWRYKSTSLVDVAAGMAGWCLILLLIALLLSRVSYGLTFPTNPRYRRTPSHSKLRIPGQVTSPHHIRDVSEMGNPHSSRSDSFTFAVVRQSSGEVLFNSTQELAFKDQYLKISTRLPSHASLYGLGESTRPAGFKLVPNSTYTLWASDTPSREINKNLYASWPFYLDARSSGVSHGVFLRNSNGMDVEFAEGVLTYKILGGVFDFSFFAGPSPLDVVEQLTDMVGKPAPMPYWSLGKQSFLDELELFFVFSCLLKVTAGGSVFLDSGDDLEIKLEQGSSTLVEFAAKKVGNRLSIKSHVSFGDFALRQGWILNRVVVLGLGEFQSASQQQELLNGKTMLPQ